MATKVSHESVSRKCFTKVPHESPKVTHESPSRKFLMKVPHVSHTRCPHSVRTLGAYWELSQREGPISPKPKSQLCPRVWGNLLGKITQSFFRNPLGPWVHGPMGPSPWGPKAAGTPKPLGIVGILVFKSMGRNYGRTIGRSIWAKHMGRRIGQQKYGTEHRATI